jgi:hypothetical protein
MNDIIDDDRQNIFESLQDGEYTEVYWDVRRKIYVRVSIVEMDIDEFQCDRDLIFNSCLTSLKSSHNCEYE